ncbi:hypothetical protein HPB51_009663 [Rhipicephalus microplus]|uniref:Uncharacterized protein n=1 Tax=Rhipicephalus microplus TaxID=6941 RepID=A0A9J6E0L0_RHIMP|nr:hypothetical protein HPB51_009663 [Rhipicephalus microplus]
MWTLRLKGIFNFLSIMSSYSTSDDSELKVRRAIVMWYRVIAVLSVALVSVVGSLLVNASSLQVGSFWATQPWLADEQEDENREAMVAASEIEAYYSTREGRCLLTTADAVRVCNRSPNRFASIDACYNSCGRMHGPMADRCFDKTLFTDCNRSLRHTSLESSTTSRKCLKYLAIANPDNALFSCMTLQHRSSQYRKMSPASTPSPDSRNFQQRHLPDRA